MVLRATRQIVEVAQNVTSNMRITRQVVEILREFNIGQGVRNVLNFQQTVDLNVVLNRTVEINLPLIQVAETTEPKNAEALDRLTDDISTFDPITGEPVNISRGLGQQIGRQLIVNRSHTDYLQIFHNVQVTHLKITGISVFATSSLVITQEAQVTNIDEELPLQQTADVIRGKGFSNNLTLGQVVEVNKTLNRVVIDDVGIGSTVSFIHLRNNSVLCSYTPFIGDTSNPNAPDPPDANPPAIAQQDYVILNYPVDNPTETIILRGPEIGDIDRISQQRVAQQSRGGNLIIYRDPKWPRIQQFILNFRGLSESEAQALLDFINISLGQLVELIDWEGRSWPGVITSTTDPIVRNRFCDIAASLTFDRGIAPTEASGIFVSANNLLTFNQVLDRQIIINPTISDNLLLNEIVSRIITVTKLIDDSLTFIQTIIRQAIFDRPVSDSLVFIQTVTRQAIFDRPVGDSLTLVQTIDRNIVLNLPIADNLVFIQTAIRQAIFDRLVSDSLVFIQTVTRQAIFDRPIADSLVFIQTATRQVIFDRPVSDGLTLVQTVDRNIILNLPIADSLVFIQTATRQVIFDRPVSDSLTLVQTVDRNIILNLPIADSLIFIQTASRQAIFDRPVSDSLVFVQTASRQAILDRPVSDSLVFVQTAIRQAILDRLVSDSLVFVQTAIRQAILDRPVSDSLVFVQTIDRDIILNLPIADNLIFIQTATRQAIFDRTVTETLTFIQTVTQQTIYSRAISQSLTFAQAPVLQIILGRTITDTLTLVQTASIPNRTKYWIKSGAAGNWNDTANWSLTSGGIGGADIPFSFDDVVFDSNGVAKCNINIDAVCNDLTTTSGYTGGGADDGHLDAGANSITIYGNAILDNKQISMGSDTWEVHGGFDFQHVSDFNSETSLLQMVGTGTLIGSNLGTEDRFLYGLHITSTATITIDTRQVETRDGPVTIDGTLTLNRFIQIREDADIIISSTGIVNGTQNFAIFDPTSTHGVITMDGTMNTSGLFAYQRPVSGARLASGTYDSQVVILAPVTGTLEFDNDTYTFNGPFELRITGAGDLTIDNSANNPTFIVKDDVFTTKTSTGILVWTKGTSTFTISGTGSQNLALDDETIEDLTINKATGTCTFTDDFTTDSFTGVGGLIDFNGKTITILNNCLIGNPGQIDGSTLNGTILSIGGNGSLNGISGTLLDFNASAAWQLEITGTASANFVDAAFSDASGFTQITATNSTDSGNNTNWSFI